MTSNQARDFQGTIRPLLDLVKTSMPSSTCFEPGQAFWLVCSRNYAALKNPGQIWLHNQYVGNASKKLVHN